MSRKGTMYGRVAVWESRPPVHCSSLSHTHTHTHTHTVKPPKKGHIGDGPVVPCREVVLFSEVFL